MFVIGPLGFSNPFILLAFIALPVLWMLLRAVPPAPVRRMFPGVTLLLGLKDDQQDVARTPWWLLLLRCLGLSALIITFAGPIFHPRQLTSATGPLVILMDNSWATAAHWPAYIAQAEQALDGAEINNRPVSIVTGADLETGAATFKNAQDWRGILTGLKPQPYDVDMSAVMDHFVSIESGFSTLWLSDGLAHEGRFQLLSKLKQQGNVAVFEPENPLYGLRDARLEGQNIVVEALRRDAKSATQIIVTARGPDPAGMERILATAPLSFAVGDTTGSVIFNLPPELRNRVTRFEIENHKSAGAIRLNDDGLKRREVGLLRPYQRAEGLAVLSQHHYLRAAFVDRVDLVEGDISDLILAQPNVIILADVAQVSPPDEVALLAWIEEGGLLLRFAGPRLAASHVARNEVDPLMPVRLRAGGRSIGGSMSWGTPKKLRDFSQSSPFSGLSIPDDIAVSSQVLAQPDPYLSERVIATLGDGTPLVTRVRRGAGQVVLFHIPANAAWSNLPLSGLFVDMLSRLTASAGGTNASRDMDLRAKHVQPIWIMDGFGQLHDAQNRPPIATDIFQSSRASFETPPGLYQNGDTTLALNVLHENDVLPANQWPPETVILRGDAPVENHLRAFFLLAAFAIFAADIIATFSMSGRMRRAAIVILALCSGVFADDAAWADTAESFALAATGDVTLAYVQTGNADIDRISLAGLNGLGRGVTQRSSVELSTPVGIDLETDPLGFFPLLYWPIIPAQITPSEQAYSKLRAYVRQGGVILFDTRDADVAGYAGQTPAQSRLADIARPFDFPVLETLPENHVLTRSFYLLDAFPGRYIGGDIWVEAGPDPQSYAAGEGLLLRNLNDSVTPVIIGGNDWAAAWAIDENGWPLLPVGRGLSGDDQRETALRFGINLVMYVLTGNYKSDQVHLPALLERLGDEP